MVFYLFQSVRHTMYIIYYPSLTEVLELGLMGKKWIKAAHLKPVSACTAAEWPLVS